MSFARDGARAISSNTAVTDTVSLPRIGEHSLTADVSGNRCCLIVHRYGLEAVARSVNLADCQK